MRLLLPFLPLMTNSPCLWCSTYNSAKWYSSNKPYWDFGFGSFPNWMIWCIILYCYAGPSPWSVSHMAINEATDAQEYNVTKIWLYVGLEGGLMDFCHDICISYSSFKYKISWLKVLLFHGARLHHAGEGNGSRQGKHAGGSRKLAGHIFICAREAKIEKENRKWGILDTLKAQPTDITSSSKSLPPKVSIIL